MPWIVILALPAALALVELGAALTLAKVLALAVKAALVLLTLLAGYLAWTHLRRTPKTQ